MTQLKIITTGKGSSGSWKCRGEQLGGQVGKVIPKAKYQDLVGTDAIVVVKRLHPSFFDAVKKSGRPWFWDLVDFYPQPVCGSWLREYAIDWVRKEIKRANPTGVIYPNRRMKTDIGIPGEVIYHHAREKAPVNPIRENVRIVGYDGSEKYLDFWRPLLESQCRVRGWQFRTNIPLHKMDIVVAFRGGKFDGYCQHYWKSNVKLANAHATGTPFIGQLEAGYHETSTGLECWADNERELIRAFDYLSEYKVRKAISARFKTHTISLSQVGEQLKSYIERTLWVS